MRQKYEISRDGPKRDLKIREYAVIDKNLKKKASEFIPPDNFSFLCEENYESDLIVEAIAKGQTALVATLRTHNIFPVAPFAARIADSVTTLYDDAENGPVELFFDDLELLPVGEVK